MLTPPAADETPGPLANVTGIKASLPAPQRLPSFRLRRMSMDLIDNLQARRQAGQGRGRGYPAASSSATAAAAAAIQPNRRGPWSNPPYVDTEMSV